MPDLKVKYTGTETVDSGLNAQVIADTVNAAGQLHSIDDTIQMRVGVACTYGALATRDAVVFVQPRVNGNFGADNNAHRAVPIAFQAGATVHQEFVLDARKCPKEFRFNVQNNSNDSITVTVWTQTGVITDQ